MPRSMKWPVCLTATPASLRQTMPSRKLKSLSLNRRQTPWFGVHGLSGNDSPGSRRRRRISLSSPRCRETERCSRDRCCGVKGLRSLETDHGWLDVGCQIRGADREVHLLCRKRLTSVKLIWQRPAKIANVPRNTRLMSARPHGFLVVGRFVTRGYGMIAVSNPKDDLMTNRQDAY